MVNSQAHNERKHAKLSASGAERYFECPGSVALSEGLPDKTSPAAAEGTRCHEVLERILRNQSYEDLKPNAEMVEHAQTAARFILKSLKDAGPGAELLIETKTSLAFLHPAAFGTLDAAVVDHFGTLNILDFKYGSYSVSPTKNLQLLFYALGIAHSFNWNFSKVRLTIIQPRARGYDGPLFWETTLLDLKRYTSIFKRAFERVESQPKLYVEGSHCFFCKAKAICPLKQSAKLSKAKAVFGASPL